MPVKPVPDGYHAITPFLMVKDVASLLKWMPAALGATERYRSTAPDGSVMHAEVEIGDSRVMLGEAGDRWPPMPVMMYLYVPDADAAYERAVRAGGQSLMAPTNHFYGDRSAGVKDPAGNQWWFATHIEDVSPEEVSRRAATTHASGEH